MSIRPRPSWFVALVALVALAVPATVATAAVGHVQIVTGQFEYAPGDTVRFTVTNHHDETIWLNGFPFWWIRADASGEYVAPCVSLPTLHPIGPGGAETHSWDQVDCHVVAPVPEGLYWVGVAYWTDSDPTSRAVSAPFCVGFDCDPPTSADDPVPGATWGRVKSLYR
jgi:hypothetical protein